MTDDTDTAEREEEAPAASLPLIDTFAALEAEIAAKEDRIERLESELQREYLDPAEGDAEAAVDDAEPDGEPGTASAETAQTADSSPADDEPRSHEDWEPATDPLTDTGSFDAADEQPGVTAEAATSAKRAADAPAPEQEPSPAADDSGLQPVRTAGSRSRDADPQEDVGAVGGESGTRSAEREFGLTMETSSNLTGGSLGSSADRERPVGSEQESSDDAPNRPDPTADRGERLSLLARRAELRDEEEVVETFVRGIEALDDVTRGMLAHYREAGDAAPVDAHVAAGGSGERQYAYARNRTLRKAGVIEHDGAGRYRYALPSLVEEAFDGSAGSEVVADAVSAIESATDLVE